MELKITTETLQTTATVFEGSPELPFEQDILLADYYPEVRRILKTIVTPKISQCYPNGNKVQIDGFVFIKIYYTCEQNKLHSYDCKIPFSKELECRETTDRVTVTVHPKLSYVNCRAVNSRRLDVRGAVTIGARVTAQKNETVVGDAEGDGVQLCKQAVTAGTVCCSNDNPFSVREEGTVDAPVQSVLRSQGYVTLSEVKCIPNKMILKGDLHIETVYCTEGSDTPLTSHHSFPVSRIVDVEGADSEHCGDVCMEVLCVETTVKSDAPTELEFEVRLSVRVKAYQNKVYTTSADAYSTRYACEYTTKPVVCEKLLGTVCEELLAQGELESSTAVEKVLDVCVVPHNAVTRVENGSLTVDVPVEVTAFVSLPDCTTEALEKILTAKYTYPLSEDCSDVLFDPQVQVTACSYSQLSDQTIQVEVRLCISGAVLCKVSQAVICNLSVDDTKPQTRTDDAALTIYYCDGGERVWDIAKYYRTSAESILTENDLATDVLPEKRVLLIPSVR